MPNNSAQFSFERTLPLDRLNQSIPKINAVTTKDVTA
jgi:hypothetical protein